MLIDPVKQDVFGWVVLSVTSLLMLIVACVLFAYTSIEEPGRICALSAALTLWPGYIVVLAVDLYAKGVRPSLALVLGLCSVLAGLLLFAFPIHLYMRETRWVAVALFLGGFAIMVPFVKKYVLSTGKGARQIGKTKESDQI